ncbi:OCT1 [Candida oxycetoniae]|uniref:Mitochondrial intermediate peptidase n=1 Tax=Candida oxycetoniae TaxID=497107 RepID=A0AAI9T2K7_9ASCO|nr:OCT1 [Candida oxycetoniae]KAI3407095.2 OCT1 [Candida oxycetoniae]
MKASLGNLRGNMCLAKRSPLIRVRYFTNAATSTDLQRVFDDKAYFKKFNGISSKPFLGKKTGLFKNNYLKDPQGLLQFSKNSKKEAQNLVLEMTTNINTRDGKLEYVKKLDQLSDILCRTIDVAEFIRVVHEDDEWVQAAQKTHEIIFEYMNQLNTNVDLYKNLVNVLQDPEITSQLTTEEIKVGEYLKQDFERSGIHMDVKTRADFVSLTQEISLLGSQFSIGTHDLESPWFPITQADFKLIDDAQLRRAIRHMNEKYPGKREMEMEEEEQSGHYFIPMESYIPYQILAICKSSQLRKKIWIALHNAPKNQIQTLNKVISLRAMLAKMLGYKSFAHYQLEHKMAKTPENVLTFLEKLQPPLKHTQVFEELKALRATSKLFQNVADQDLFTSIKPWDRDFLANKLQNSCSSSSRQGEKNFINSVKLPDYFSVGTVISGLSELFTSLYNISLVPEPTLSGEVWDEDQVRKLKVVDIANSKTLGFLYLDFWSKKVLPSHFTIVCSRRLNKTESRDSHGQLVQLDQDYQLPVISLVCNFNVSSGDDNLNEPTLLSLNQVDTIFHEMGHAMHSMIGRTELHNLSGTRCATDFVEIPSVLMEGFSKDIRVLSQIGRHYQTNEPIPKHLLLDEQKHRNTLQACETFMQSKMATLDQALHSSDIVDRLYRGLELVDSTEIYHLVESKLGVFADKWSTWHGKLPHLFSYGAVYYSYMLDRAIADMLWHKLFEADPWSRDAGEKYKESILKWGGTKDPWQCLADAVGNDGLREGDSHAMQLIGENAHL